MATQYSIIDISLKDATLKTPDYVVSQFVDSARLNQKVIVNVNSKKVDGVESNYQVDLKVSVKKMLDSIIVCSFTSIYSALVNIIEPVPTKKEIKYLLNVIIPQFLYSATCPIADTIFNCSAFGPIKLYPYDFKNKQFIEPIDNNEDEECILSYDWIIDKILSTKEGADFLNSYRGLIKNDCSVFNSLPIYQYFYRFISPIDYHHPQIVCIDSFWDILFQLLFAEAEEVKILKKSDGDPEIEISFENFKHIIVSEMNIDEIKELTYSLAVKAFTETSVHIASFDTNEKYSHCIRNDSPLLEELMILYNCKEDISKKEDVEFVKHIYMRTQNYILQTLPYKFMHFFDGIDE